jgi:hypothetical protein
MENEETHQGADYGALQSLLELTAENLYRPFR